MRVIINGGGPVGCMAALIMLQYTSDITIVEKRRDLRLISSETGRSINLVLTSRGLFALNQVGLKEKALNISVKVEGRLIHPVNINENETTPTFQPYGVDTSEVNYSISRNQLNAMLLQAAEERGVKIINEYTLMELSLEDMKATYCGSDGNYITLTGDLFIGADGVSSLTRKVMVDYIRKEGKEVIDKIERLGISYKELTFPSKVNENGKYEYPMNHRGLHIWPRGVHFLMALADLQYSFTGTMYLPDGSAPIEVPQTEEIPSFSDFNNNPHLIETYIQTYYPDVPKYISNYKEQLQQRPASFLATLYISKWYYSHRVVLLGDAAHAIVPFFGQGLNLGFESVILLDSFINHYYLNNNQKELIRTLPALEQAFEAYERYHHKSADAIASLAKENFIEMSYKVGLEEFRERKQIENWVETKFKEKFRSRYFLVTKTLIPYYVAKQAGEKIDNCITELIEICRNKGCGIEEIPLKEIESCIDKHFTPFVEANGLHINDRLFEYYPKKF